MAPIDPILLNTALNAIKGGMTVESVANMYDLPLFVLEDALKQTGINENSYVCEYRNTNESIYTYEKRIQKQENVLSENNIEKNKTKEQDGSEDKFFVFTDKEGKFSLKETAKTAVKTIFLPLMIFQSCNRPEYQQCMPKEVTVINDDGVENGDPDNPNVKRINELKRDIYNIKREANYLKGSVTGDYREEIERLNESLRVNVDTSADELKLLQKNYSDRKKVLDDNYKRCIKEIEEDSKKRLTPLEEELSRLENENAEPDTQLKEKLSRLEDENAELAIRLKEDLSRLEENLSRSGKKDFELAARLKELSRLENMDELITRLEEELSRLENDNNIGSLFQ